ncbi:MAG: hypothetical protein HYR56_21075 [Acidobacteria bacterium]|nr:hypothetical protein [Acidobacteriota bacterium]MBI3426868.1 hypothetical protein [Acidobacteriota bacterium]
MKYPSIWFVRRVLPLLTLVFGAGILLSGPRLDSFSLLEFEPVADAETQEAKPGADEWFYEQRAYPLSEIPLGVRAKAVEQLAVLEERQQLRRQQLYGRQAAEVVADSQPKWEALGPRPIGPVARANAGRATALALDPRYDGVNNQTIYAGAAQGGVWKSSDNGASWTPLTDNLPSLAIGAIAVDPSNPNVLYVGSGEGNASADSYFGAGLYKSVDGGASWRVITGPVATIAPRVPVFLNIALMHIAFDSQNPRTLYVCTRAASSYGPSGGGSITAGAPGQRGVWKSIDGGETWRNLDPLGNGGVTNANDILINPQTPGIVIAGVEGQGLFRSTAGGEPGTWTKLTEGLPASDVRRIAIADGPPLPPATRRTLYAALTVASNSNNLHGVYKSTDDGDTWTKLGVPASITQVWYNLALAVNQQDANIVYFGLVGFYRSLDGGQTWQAQNGSGNGALHSDQHFALAVPNKPNIFFITSDGGLWRSDNADAAAAMTWASLNATLNTVQFQGVAIHPTDPNFIVGGTQDNGTLRFTGDPAWLSIAGADGGFALIDQTNPNIVWQSQQNQSRTATQSASFGPRVSTNSGNSGTFTDRGCRASCQPVPGSMHPDDRVGFYGPLAQHTGFTTPGNVVYWGTHRLYRTADLGVTWTGLGPSADGFGQDLTNSTTGRLAAIAAQPKLDTSTTPPGEIVWTGSSNGIVMVTTDAGKLADATFTNVTKAPLPNRFVTAIGVDPNEPKRAYVAYSGFNVSTPTTLGHLFVTDDLGQSWRDISGDLPDVPVTAVEPDPTQAGTLYIGTDLGVFQTTDGGATWVRLGNGMPRVATFMVRYQKATRSLVVATHGRGIYRLKLAAPVVTVSSASFSREALAVEGIASAFGTGLATRSEAAQSIPLPTELAGTTVRLTDANGVEQLAPLFFVSPQQVNYQIPPNVAAGAVTVTITSGDNAVSFGIERVRNLAPALFTANANGRGVPAGYGVRLSGGVQSPVVISRLDPLALPPAQPEAIDLGPEGDQVVLVLFGTGLRRRPDLSGVDVTIGGVKVPAQYAGEVAGLVGLDQLNFGVPRSLIGKGEVDVMVNASGVTGNTVRVRIK